jgi:hypothetical protein
VSAPFYLTPLVEVATWRPYSALSSPGVGRACQEWWEPWRCGPERWPRGGRVGASGGGGPQGRWEPTWGGGWGRRGVWRGLCDDVVFEHDRERDDRGERKGPEWHRLAVLGPARTSCFDRMFTDLRRSSRIFHILGIPPKGRINEQSRTVAERCWLCEPSGCGWQL